MKVIIVGAGMAGLMAARELRKQNAEVVIVEALAQAGGRTQTVRPENFECDVEAGAEFIHGELPITLQLLKEAGIGREQANLTMYRFTGRQMRKGFGEGAGWEQFFKEINALDQDCMVGARSCSGNFRPNAMNGCATKLKRWLAGSTSQTLTGLVRSGFGTNGNPLKHNSGPLADTASSLRFWWTNF